MMKIRKLQIENLCKPSVTMVQRQPIRGLFYTIAMELMTQAMSYITVTHFIQIPSFYMIACCLSETCFHSP